MTGFSFSFSIIVTFLWLCTIYKCLYFFLLTYITMLTNVQTYFGHLRQQFAKCVQWV